MLIESKLQFNMLATGFGGRLANFTPKPIRASKIREMLAKAIGFKSHNGLLSELPINSQQWMEPKAVARLTELLVNHDGIQAPVADLMRLTIEQIDSAIDTFESTTNTRTIDDYAFLRTDEYDGKTVICLTPLGRKVYDEVEATHDSIPIISNENLDRWEQALFKIMERHPANPWPKAMYCYSVAPSFWQSNWCEELARHQTYGFSPDADKGFREHSGNFARELLPVAKTAIEQFEKWLGPKAKEVTDHNLISNDSETFYWPAILYMGGMIALNCGETRLAKRWLSLNYKLVADDNFGARYGLSVLRLNEGKGSIQSLFPKDSTCAWGWLARALDAYARRNADKAIQNFLMALKNNYGVFEAFGRQLQNREQIRIMSNHDAPAFIQEFMFRTQPFWNAYPSAQLYFATICHDPYVQVRVEDFHIHTTEGIGSGLKSEEFRAEHKKRLAESWEALQNSVVSAARNAWPQP